MAKVNYETVEKSQILSKVISLTKMQKGLVQVEYSQAWHPDYVTMDKAKELSKKHGVKIG